MRLIKFKVPGQSITIGGQRIDQNNITPEIYDGLIQANPQMAEIFEDVNQEIKTAGEPGADKAPKSPKKDA